MNKLIAVAALLVATSTAQAGDSFSFKIGGQSIHIDAPRDCSSASCISVSIPGVYEHGPKRKRKRDNSGSPSEAATGRPAPRESQTAVAPLPPTASTPAPPAPNLSAGPLQAPTIASTQTSQSLEPANGTSTIAGMTATTTSSTPANPTPATEVVAVAPVAPPAQPQEIQRVVTEPSPIGIWITEKKEGKVRIEACGSNLCGYSINGKSSANGDKVLINMKPGRNKWSGRIYDPNSGSTYDSTIAMKGRDLLRVQGCAFGGMFCGGQTWSRVN